MHEEPLVSVLTPVYNGEPYLAECIESVLAQTYQNWEYTILNNASTDGTLEISERYAKQDKRVRICSNDQLLNIIANHNRAFQLVSPVSKYCKIVSADDWLFPECLERMVGLAEANPSVGLVGSYLIAGGGSEWSDWSVVYDQVPYPSTMVPGRVIGRIHMLGGPNVFGTPTSLLYRADLVRRFERFYPNDTAEADTSACCRVVQQSDYGFVHQVLSYARVHKRSQTTRSQKINAYLSSNISDLLEYGDAFLSDTELKERLNQLIKAYYQFLAVSALKFRERDFWVYHVKRLKEIEHPLSNLLLAKAVLIQLLILPLNLTKLFRVLKE